MEERLLRRREVEQKIGVGRSTLYLWMQQGRFPHPISIGGGRAVGWLASEVDAWIARQVESSRSHTK